MAIELLCRKIGMTQVYDDKGNCIPVTVLEAEPNTVVQKKTVERDGYAALQLGGAGARPSRVVPKGELGHFEKSGVGPLRKLAESRVSDEEVAGYEAGQQIAPADVFEKGQFVDVIGNSKGRGMTGVVKRHNFAVKRRTHGTHEFFRHGGSIGAGAYPGKVFKGMGMAGRHGNSRVTVRNLEVIEVDAERSLLFVRGGVPGHRNAVLKVRQALAARA
ncbi:MAG: 50S ribosomal protein L3 [Myxococcales bacterium]|nr:50S ribosomal protein L3 [Myxococcales bacterium]